MMNTFRQMGTILMKDIRSELRSRYALNAILAFVGSSLLLMLFALHVDQLEAGPQSGILWIIILFAALLSLSRSFVSETEQNTFSFLRLHATASAVYGGKLLYNFIFTFVINIVVFILYLFMLGIVPAAVWQLIIILILGSAGLASIATMLAAVVSQADRKGAVFSILSIPLLFPLILILADATKSAFISSKIHLFMENFWAMIGFAGATIAAGFLLFEFIWED
jgi:heme exporter protein B